MTVTRTVEEPFAPGVTVVRESKQNFQSMSQPLLLHTKILF
jgi:hypothetical protein